MRLTGVFTLCMALAGTHVPRAPAAVRDLDWPETVSINRPGTFWWWMGSAVDRENITWNLETMRRAGIGGATIVPTIRGEGT